MSSHPLVYEINTRCWLNELSVRQQRPITLSDVPDDQFAEWRRWGLTHVWLMGVWSVGPLARTLALDSPDQRQAYSRALPDWTPNDVTGSPFAIADYRVADALGGDEGLAAFRARLNQAGLRLLLDFVPNHLGLDHPWVALHPDWFVGSPAQRPETFAQPTTAGTRWLAYGKDPNFSAWTDTAQLDYRLPAIRQTMTQLLGLLTQRCDGVRCDMAMLLLSDVFNRTWRGYPQPDAETTGEFWSDAIAAARKQRPDFLLLAEAYWGLEVRLQALGFDYVYDKEMYDRLLAHNAARLQSHLAASSTQSLATGTRFLENHDEPRIASCLGLDEHRAAALLVLGLPGMCLLHEGQLAGATLRTPVALSRRAPEPKDARIAQLYEQLLAVLSQSAVRRGDAELLVARPAWPENPTALNLVLVQWQATPPDFDLVLLNLAPHRSQGYARLTVPDLDQCDWVMFDRLGPERYRRSGTELKRQGLYLDLPGHGAQLFHFQPAT